MIKKKLERFLEEEYRHYVSIKVGGAKFTWLNVTLWEYIEYLEERVRVLEEKVEGKEKSDS